MALEMAIDTWIAPSYPRRDFDGMPVLKEETRQMLEAFRERMEEWPCPSPPASSQRLARPVPIADWRCLWNRFCAALIGRPYQALMLFHHICPSTMG